MNPKDRLRVQNAAKKAGWRRFYPSQTLFGGYCWIIQEEDGLYVDRRIDTEIGSYAAEMDAIYSLAARLLNVEIKKGKLNENY